MGHKVGRISLSFSSLLGQQFGEEGAEKISQGMSAPPALALLLFTSRGVNGDRDRKSERQKSAKSQRAAATANARFPAPPRRPAAENNTLTLFTRPYLAEPLSLFLKILSPSAGVARKERPSVGRSVVCNN